MNEVDRLYNKWREEQCIQAGHILAHVPEYIKSSVVSETSKALLWMFTSKALNEFIENNKNDLCDDEIKMYIKYAEEELEKRANKHCEFAAQVRKKQLETRGKTSLEQTEIQNRLNSGSMADTKTIKTEGKNTMEKIMNVNTKIDIAALIQAKMAEKMMDAIGDGKDIPLTKLTIMQSLANGGSINVTELIRAKQTEKLLKDLNENKDLSIGKLLTYQALTGEGGFDVNALIQAQFVEKLFADDEKAK